MSAESRELLELAKRWERDADAHRQRLGRSSAQAQQACIDHARELREALAHPPQAAKADVAPQEPKA